MKKKDTSAPPIRPLQWVGGLDGHVDMMDQTLLPETLKTIICEDVETIHDAAQTSGQSASAWVRQAIQERLKRDQRKRTKPAK